MMEELKACPFCGGKALLFDAKDYGCAFVECLNCGASTSKVSYATDKDAKNAWNRRAAPKNKPLTCEGCVSVDKPTYSHECAVCTRNPERHDRYEARKPEGSTS